MLKPNERRNTIQFIQSLQDNAGPFSNQKDTPVSPSATLSAVKALAMLGKQTPRPDAIVAYVTALYDKETSAFVSPATRQADVLTSAGCLLLLHALGAYKHLRRIAADTLRFMARHARTREEHFMLIGVLDECQMAADVTESIRFFRALETGGTFGDSALMNAIAASALLRAGEVIAQPEPLITLLLSAQCPDGAFANDNGDADLWTTYCVMRALGLLNVVPKRQPLLSWLKTLYQANGGFSATGSMASLNETYQVISVLDWLTAPLLAEAEKGGHDTLTSWLAGGGSADVFSPSGWTPLLMAAARGKADYVKLLISRSTKCAEGLTSTYDEGDVSLLLLAAQAGDLETVQYLLMAFPGQLYDTSAVNGHSVLLQTAFYGSEQHYQVAEWILTHLNVILQTNDAETLQAARKKLLVMTNVRGYNCTRMTQLWSNRKMHDLFSQYDTTTPDEQNQYTQKLLERLMPVIPANEKTAQALAEAGIQLINNALRQANDGESDRILEATTQELLRLFAHPYYDINRLAGPLGQPILVATITGVDSNDNVTALRYALCHLLLEHGADPDQEERHPMAVDAVIRSAVLNHFTILQLLADYMPPLAFAAALNYRPPINGQTALQDTVHRALTADKDSLPRHLEQIEWTIGKGARIDVEDHTGTSPQTLARKALTDPVFSQNAENVLKALGIPATEPHNLIA